MDVKEYLLSQKIVYLSAIANKMWPSNTQAYGYLSRKLNNLDNRTFTKADEENAKKALKSLGEDLIKESDELS